MSKTFLAPVILPSATLNNVTARGLLFADSAKQVVSSAALTNGQLLIGSTGADPVVATITGTANRVTVTNSAGGIQLSGPQDLHTAATPQFGSIFLSALLGAMTFLSTNSIAGALSSLFSFQRAGGSVGAYTPALNGWSLGIAAFTGQTTTAASVNTSGGASIEVLAEENFSSTAGGSAMLFSTAAIGSVSRTERARINNAGHLLINRTTETAGAELVQIAGSLSISSNTLVRTYTAFTDGAAAAAGTLLNAPVAGNPTKWIPVNDNGTTRYIPCW